MSCHTTIPLPYSDCLTNFVYSINSTRLSLPRVSTRLRDLAGFRFAPNFHQRIHNIPTSELTCYKALI